MEVAIRPWSVVDTRVKVEICPSVINAYTRISYTRDCGNS